MPHSQARPIPSGKTPHESITEASLVGGGSCIYRKTDVTSTVDGTRYNTKPLREKERVRSFITSCQSLDPSTGGQVTQLETHLKREINRSATLDETTVNSQHRSTYPSARTLREGDKMSGSATRRAFYQIDLTTVGRDGKCSGAPDCGCQAHREHIEAVLRSLSDTCPKAGPELSVSMVIDEAAAARQKK